MNYLSITLLNNNNSENSRNILNIINDNITSYNKKKIIVSISLHDKSYFERKEVQEYVSKHNITSVPYLTITSNDNTDAKKIAISGTNNVIDFLLNLSNTNTFNNISNNHRNNNCNNNNNSNLNSNNQNNMVESIETESDEEDFSKIEKYMTNEICSKNFNGADSILSTGHDDSFLMKKMNEYKSKKGGTCNAPMNTNKLDEDGDNTSSNTNKNTLETRSNTSSSYENKLLNKANKYKNTKTILKENMKGSADADLISSKFLDNVDEEDEE
jgi:hypothetical protein